MIVYRQVVVDDRLFDVVERIFEIFKLATFPRNAEVCKLGPTRSRLEMIVKYYYI